MSLIAELRRRNVIRMAGLYLVGAWLVVQVAGTILPMFAAPEWIARSVVIVLAIGFVPALVFAWLFELTPQGLKRDADVLPQESIAPHTAQRMNRMIIAVLLLALVYFGLDKFVFAPHRDAPRNATAAMTDARPTATVIPAATDRSIAVLPFVNMSSDNEQEYFSDGLSEELLNQLAQISQLRVIARTSSFSFKGKAVDVATIASTLGVAHILEGSVRKSGNTLRITAQLVRAADSSHLWSQTYDRDRTDIFRIQDEISKEVVAALRLKLLPAQQVTNTQKTRNPEAYDQYLIGRDATGISDPATIQRALAAYRRAIALDPQYANAYAGLAWVLASEADFATDPAQRADKLKQAYDTADQSVALGPDLPDGYAMRAGIRYRLLWDWEGADADFRRALALDANHVRALTNYAQALFFGGHREEAIAMDRKATRIDPLSADAWAGLGWHLADAGQDAEARTVLKRALDLSPNAQWPNVALARLELEDGDIESALVHFNRVPDGFRLAGIAMTAYTRGNERESQQALETLKANFAVGFAYQIAQAYAWRGDKDQAFEWLERAYRQHDAGVPRMRIDPLFEKLHDDQRFAALVKKMGFAQ